MSEYQYYEFVAIDKPLTPKQLDEIRQVSTRAELSATRFVNEYHFGSFKGDPHKFIQRYYDAMMYFANWGTHRFMFRLPADAVDAKLARACCSGDSASVTIANDYAIFDLGSEDEGGEDWDGEPSLAAFLGVRQELAEGDTRVLYLAWLAQVTAGEIAEDKLEPFEPIGLDKLTGAQRGLAEFLRIDQDLIAAAADGREATAKGEPDVSAWLQSLPPAEKDRIVEAVARGEGSRISMELRRRLRESQPAKQARAVRTVSQLRALMDSAGQRRKAAEQKKREAEHRRKMDKLRPREPELWREVHAMIQAKSRSDYRRIAELLADLRDLADTDGRTDGFTRQLKEIRTQTAGRRAFQETLTSRGLP